ncbi:MAG: FAD-dependent oxidoreductase [Clostridia bacterium]|nr:FAD-dependent oxidoreductase [Clostridia bacterium]
MTAFKTIVHHADLCVVGGGIAGICAAVSAARHGAHVVLMQERPMLGGNASSEIRMWVCGAHGDNNKETGLIEELMLENQYRNPDKNYSVWDGIMYELVRYQPGIELLLNCTCNECEMDGSVVKSVKGWQLTTQTFHEVHAALFADCSGDSVLAPLTGAEFRIGREARKEFGEDIAPETADRKTMGMSCMIQAREETHPSEFIPPKWAYKYTKSDLPHRVPDMRNVSENFWYLELGGECDSIADSETLRDELLKTAYGLWDYVKNDPENKEQNKNWRLDWMGILPGKRESRRYIGDYIMTQNDVRAEGRFEDLVAYGGWTMDDHHPCGFRTPERPNIFHPAPSPYGIPYRSMYSKNIENLMFAGRNISVTHTAMSSTRVMATCGTIGQAVGTAAAIAVRDGLTPRGVYEQRLNELKQTLMEDDSYLPFNRRDIPLLTRNAVLCCPVADAENLRNGLDRPIQDKDNGCHVALGARITYEFPKAVKAGRVRIIFDSDLNRETLPECERKLRRNMIHNRPLDWADSYVPKTMVKAYRLEGVTPSGETILLYETANNYQRRNFVELNCELKSVTLIPLSTWGADDAHIFSFDIAERV